MKNTDHPTEGEKEGLFAPCPGAFFLSPKGYAGIFLEGSGRGVLGT